MWRTHRRDAVRVHGVSGAAGAATAAAHDQFDVVALIKQWNRRRDYRDMVSRGYNPFEYSSRQRPGEPPPLPIRAGTDHERAGGDPRSRLAARPGHRGTPLPPTQATGPAAGMPKQAQLDVANHLAAEQRYPEAAEAYETLFRVYPKVEQIEQLELMLGIDLLALSEPTRACKGLPPACHAAPARGKRAGAGAGRSCRGSIRRRHRRAS